MAAYRLRIKRSVAKDLRGIPSRDLQRILARIRDLAHDPRPSAAERLASDHRYRLRQGRYRILYEVHDRDVTVIVVKVAHRREAYRDN